MDDVERRLFIFRSAHRAREVIYLVLQAPRSVGLHIEIIRLAPHACPLSLGSYMILRMPLENKRAGALG